MAMRRPSGEDVFDMLKDDHLRISRIIQDARNAASDRREEITSQLSRELNQHIELEEKYFYPVLLEFDEVADQIQDIYSDHDNMKESVQELVSQDFDSADWETTLEALDDTYEDHVEMEENEIFPQAVELLSLDQIDEIADQFESTRLKAAEVPRKRRPEQRAPRAER